MTKLHIKRFFVKDPIVFMNLISISLITLITKDLYVAQEYGFALVNAFFLGGTLFSLISYLSFRKNVKFYRKTISHDFQVIKLQHEMIVEQERLIGKYKEIEKIRGKLENDKR